MKDFDPSVPSIVHDRLNNETFEWTPAAWKESYEKYATEGDPGVIAWDGRLLDGWAPIQEFMDTELAELGIDGNHGFAMLGVDIHDGEVEFEEILTDAPEGSREWRAAALQAFPGRTSA